MKTMKSWIAVVLCLVMLMSMLTSCGQGSSAKENKTTAGAQNPDNETSAADGNQDLGQGAQAGELTLPLCEEKEELTVWTLYFNNFLEDPNDIEGVKAMEEATNVHINWIPIGIMELQEKFGLLLTSGNLPDIIYAPGCLYPGGLEKGVEDGIFIDCTELIETYMPNYCAAINTDESIKKDVTTDSGRMVAPYGLVSTETTFEAEAIWNGLCLRKDMLDAWGLEMPQTIDQWHDVLTVAKEKGVESPLMIMNTGIMMNGAFATAYGIGTSWYEDNGAIKYGPMEDGYRQYLEMMRQWYSEGLISDNFVANNALLVDNADIEHNKVFAFSQMSGYCGKQLSAKKMINNQDAYVQAVTNPVLKEGDTPVQQNVLTVAQHPIYITAACKNPELAAKWLDYQFTDAGVRTNFYGVEGVSYELDENGLPQYTDLIMNNPDGLTPNDAVYYYARGNGLGRYDYTHSNKLANSGASNETVEAAEIFDAQETRGLPVNLSMSEDEGARYNTKYAAIETFVQEYTCNYILGKDNRSFDEFVQSLKDYGIEECMEIQQAALDRYNNR